MKYFFLPFFTLLLFPYPAHASSVQDYCPESLLSQTANEPLAPDIIGVAVDPDKQTFLYCEYYFKIDQNRFVTHYKNAEKQLIATKEKIYGDNLLQPDVVQEDLRNGEIRQARVMQSSEGSEATNSLNVNYKKANTEKIKTANIPLSNALVIDAGFDEAIRKFWPDLIERKKVELDFLSIVHLKPFRLRISEVNVERCPQAMFEIRNSENAICFKVRPSSSFLNLFAAPLLLKYDKSTQRLLTYSGNVNITNIDGKTQAANIYYRYLN